MSLSDPFPSIITVAVIGCGKRGDGKVGWAIGHAHAQGWIAAVPNLRLCAVDPSEENLHAFGERFKLPPENLFPGTEALYAALIPDYVSICTWPALHAPQVIGTIRRSGHSSGHGRQSSRRYGIFVSCKASGVTSYRTAPRSIITDWVSACGAILAA